MSRRDVKGGSDTKLELVVDWQGKNYTLKDKTIPFFELFCSQEHTP